MPLITKEYKFCAAHQYWNNNWSKEENLDVFGKDVKNHGHNYILRVTVSGKINHDSGFLVDLKWLNTIIEDKIIDVLEEDFDLYRTIARDVHSAVPKTQLYKKLWNEFIIDKDEINPLLLNDFAVRII